MNQNVQNQYKTPAHLNTRISIHEKYSTNKQPFGDWIMEHYEIGSGFRILELGCGTGSMWQGKAHLLKDAHLTLSDFSAAMLDLTRKNTACFDHVDYQIVDIQQIPFAEDSFDMVIANMMLYHVPDLHQGLREVRRVLKPGSKFYCATYGEHGIMEFINDTLCNLGISGQIGKTFTLQNGESILTHHFESVQRYEREDGLAITCVDDFVEYVLSTSGLTGLADCSADALRCAFEEKMIDGVLYVPKEYGMFICE